MGSYFFTASGMLKALTLAVGGVAYGLGIYSYDETIVQEEFFIRTVQATIIVSLIYFGIHLIIPEKMESSDTNRAIDIAFHITAAVTLLVAGSLIIYSAVDNEFTYCILIYTYAPHHFCQFYGAKLAAGIVTLSNGVIYTVVAASVFIMQPSIRSRPRRIFIPHVIPANENKRQLGPPRTFYYGSK